MGRFSKSLLHFLVIIIIVAFCASAEHEQIDEEEFTEALLLRPLPDRKVLAHFHFQTRAPSTTTYGRHHRLFPKSIYQLVHKFRVRKMELSFTQGRWNYERWGGYDPVSSNNAKPPGVELWADFDVPQHQIDESWKNLTHALSGLFCASINFLEHSTAYSAPQWRYRSSAGKLRYGSLPREAVCTENLTPWLKLLPCRDKAGLSALMDRPSIYRGYYHSQRLHLTSSEFDTSKLSTGIVVEQTLTIVLQPRTLGAGAAVSSKTLQPSWTLTSLFGRKLSGKCSLSKSSNVYVQFEKNLAFELEKLWNKSGSEILLHKDFQSNPIFEITVSPDRVIKEVESVEREGSSILYEFLVEDHCEVADLGLKWKVPMIWSCQQAPLRANRFLMGSGNERGAIAIQLKSTWSNEQRASFGTEGCWLRADIFQVVPWYVKVYFHTLKVFVDGELQSVRDNMENIHVSPSEDKVSPGVMEMTLRLPCGVKTAALTLEFDKGFLHIDEYPPDANQGFDIPSALLSFSDFQTSTCFDDNLLNKPPILSKLQERNPVLSYTEVLLVPLTTPDFSMPYNVITITCTVFALYFGSLLNALRRRAGEEERLLRSKAAKKTATLPLMLAKLSANLQGRTWQPTTESPPSSSSRNYKRIVKVILIAGVAIVWQYYFR